MIPALLTAAVLSQASVHLNAPDKDAHFAVSVVGATATYAAFMVITDDRTARVAAAIAVPLAAGFGREFTQRQPFKEAAGDMAFNLFGAAFGAIFSYAVTELLWPAEKPTCSYLRKDGDTYRMCVENWSEPVDDSSVVDLSEDEQEEPAFPGNAHENKL